ncbi:hypothetical protein AB1Y20_004194 [Prymnesium parvum]|uniref:Uncharacterized protein n=1 Tax=Prymnesium parvum TaxID=97485 RepID=A0AB34J960_PRYPA|mmetsp:Transcript_4028/g.10088  ORF Transcript_4028/g.10088 Transcript_4028/m.10088 type:complete len:114 (-) Transcript_4028:133-474(-)
MRGTVALLFLLLLREGSGYTSGLRRLPTLINVHVGAISDRQVVYMLEPAADEDDEDAKMRTQVGTKTYYEGFLSSPLEESRGDGTEQALKLGLATTGVVGVLLVGFLASNGLV